MTDYSDRNIYGAIRYRTHFDESSGEMIGMTAYWEGGPKVLITDEYLEAADPKWLKRDGDYLTIGSYRLHIVGYDESVHYTIAERIDE